MAINMQLHEATSGFGQSPLDVLIVLGRGNSAVEGVSEPTLMNAMYAGRLSLTSDFSPRGVVITTGLGPERIRYPQSEADAMADVVRIINPGVAVLSEAESTNTFENILHASRYIPEETRTVGIVGTLGHSERAATIARNWLSSEIAITPLVSEVPVSVTGRALERTLGMLTSRYVKNIVPGDDSSLLAASESYHTRLARLKNSPLRKLHSGRK